MWRDVAAATRRRARRGGRTSSSSTKPSWPTAGRRRCPTTRSVIDAGVARRLGVHWQHRRLAAARVHPRVHAHPAPRSVGGLGPTRARRLRPRPARVSEPVSARVANRGPRHLRRKRANGEGRLHAGDFRAMSTRMSRQALEPLDRVNGGLTYWPGGSCRTRTASAFTPIWRNGSVSRGSSSWPRRRRAACPSPRPACSRGSSAPRSESSGRRYRSGRNLPPIKRPTTFRRG